MTTFGIVPPEPPQLASLTGLAPSFASKVEQMLNTMAARGHDPVLSETVRSAERQAWLYGFGRSYDDGRGIVTNAATGYTSWHFYGLAVDVVSARDGWSGPSVFWMNLLDVAHSLGLVSGMDWQRTKTLGGDRPHVQWGPGMRYTPSLHARVLYLTGGSRAVWKAVGAP